MNTCNNMSEMGISPEYLFQNYTEDIITCLHKSNQQNHYIVNQQLTKNTFFP